MFRKKASAFRVEDTCRLLFPGYLLILFFIHEYEGSMFLRNVVELPDYTALNPRRLCLKLKLV
jgi:hypothetical protein